MIGISGLCSWRRMLLCGIHRIGRGFRWKPPWVSERPLTRVGRRRWTSQLRNSRSEQSRHVSSFSQRGLYSFGWSWSTSKKQSMCSTIESVELSSAQRPARNALQKSSTLPGTYNAPIVPLRWFCRQTSRETARPRGSTGAVWISRSGTSVAVDWPKIRKLFSLRRMRHTSY